MWGILAAIIGALVGFGAGAVGLDKIGPGKTVPVQSHTIQACYNPQPSKNLTLKWPSDFQSFSNRRKDLNPKYFAGENTTFVPNLGSSDCQQMIMTDLAGNFYPERKYFQVRENVRISSCKTDELAGPFATGSCPGEPENTAKHNRGICTINGYPDLRKIADTVKDGQTLEIFWNPFSYNVGCDYAKDDNCGPGQRRNVNLKDFIYVLKKRDAFEPDRTNAGCPAQWDAGSTNYDACSHYFDVYVAEDFWNNCISYGGSDPDHQCYFLSQVVTNCKEETIFYPAVETNFTIPPFYIKTPFISQTNSPASGTTDKIIPSDLTESNNYLIYIWGRPDLINPFKTSLLKTVDKTGPLDICPATPLPTTASPTTATTNCYDPLGTIIFADGKGNTFNYKAYSQSNAPQTFSLVDMTDPVKVYVYTITDKEVPSNTDRNSSLQLRKMGMISRNQWTWATPNCKPALYFYPEKTTDLSVKLALDGQLTKSDPLYDPQTGWKIKVNPEGKIESTINNPATPAGSQESRNYPYLYYEALLQGINLPKEGFVVERSKIKEKISEMMEEIGFNEKETADFLSYWLPRLQEKPYYFISLLPENLINEKEKLSFSVNPDTLIRTRFVFEGLDYPISVVPININKYERKGFVVTDWGGTLVGKSCDDIEIK